MSEFLEDVQKLPLKLADWSTAADVSYVDGYNAAIANVVALFERHAPVKSQDELGWEGLLADGGLPEARVPTVVVPAGWYDALKAAQPVLRKVIDNCMRQAGFEVDAPEEYITREEHERRAEAVRCALLPTQ